MAISPVNEILTSFQSKKLARILDNNTLLLQKSLERLTSGLRIVDPGDDPSGLAQTVKLNSQIKRLDAMETILSNASDMVRSQSDFLSTVSKKLSRLSELAVLSSNTSITAQLRSSYQIEFAQIQAFISDIGRRTFNNQALFETSYTTIIDQDGAQYTLQAITYNANAAAGGINDVFFGTVSVSTTTAAADAQATVSTAIANLGILQARASSTKAFLDDANDLLVSLEENLQSTVDRIQNTNTTTETVEFNRLSLLTQTGQTMLANYETLRLGLLDLLRI
jgi:flagellin